MSLGSPGDVGSEKARFFGGYLGEGGPTSMKAPVEERLKKVLSSCIHEDQLGFLPKRYIWNNIRTILNILEYYETHVEKELAIVCVHVEKAFDNVCWDFMLEHLKVLIGVEDFYQMIQAIYTSQKANILVNGELTDSINVYRGTRQGSPLSLLLFITTLEILNTSIWENKEIRGLKVRGQEFKLIAFADDLTIIIEDPLNSYKALKEEFEQYKEVVGMKINFTKSKMLVKKWNKLSQRNWVVQWESKWFINLSTWVYTLLIEFPPYSETIMKKNLKGNWKGSPNLGKFTISLIGSYSNSKNEHLI